MIINSQILTLPPYLSTPWKNISSLHALPEGETFKLVVILNNRMRVAIPDLDRNAVDQIFKAHAQYGLQPESTQISQPAPFSIPIMPSSGGIDLLNSSMQHNPDQADSPEMPKEILEKITGIAKVLGLEDFSHFPKPEPHCNCPFCQIARAFHGDSIAIKVEEEVSAEDLTFRTWDIKQSAENLYIVSNPLDENEHYSIFLGEPLGCTCGQKHCEHIRAVLNS